MLAEDFFASTFICMKKYYDSHEMTEAQNEQMWKLNMSTIFGEFGAGQTERCIYPITGLYVCLLFVCFVFYVFYV